MKVLSKPAVTAVAYPVLNHWKCPFLGSKKRNLVFFLNGSESLDEINFEFGNESATVRRRSREDQNPCCLKSGGKLPE